MFTDLLLKCDDYKRQDRITEIKHMKQSIKSRGDIVSDFFFWGGGDFSIFRQKGSLKLYSHFIFLDVVAINVLI